MKRIHIIFTFFITTFSYGLDYGSFSLLPDTLRSQLTVGTSDTSNFITILNPSNTVLNWQISKVNPVISAGQFHNLVLSSDGTVAGWGIPKEWNDYGQSKIPLDLPPAISVSSGGYHSLLLLEDGSLLAWGDNTYRQSQIPNGLKKVKAISAGEYHNLVLHEDGTVTSWGSNKYEQSDVPQNLKPAIGVSAGYYHSVALHEDGTITVWGSNEYGQLNFPDILEPVIAISAGVAHTLVLHDNGTVSAWGDNGYGQGTVPENLDSTVVAIAAGENHNLVLLEDGTVRAWGISTGWTYFGQTDVPENLSNVLAISTGSLHNFVLNFDGSVTAWGKNDAGQTDIPDHLFLGIPIPNHLIGNPIPNWLTISETQGFVLPGESMNIPIQYSGKNIRPDTYQTEITLVTNDLDHTIITIPVIMNVEEIPFNAPPELMEIGLQNMDEDSSIEIRLSAMDVESEYMDFLVNSHNPNILVHLNDDILTISPELNYHGESKITVIAGDGDLVDSETFTVVVNPVNDPPSSKNLTLSPNKPTGTNDLHLTYQFVDPENDPEGPTIIEWYKNEEIQPKLEGFLTIPGNLTECNDSWVSLVKVHDGTETGQISVSNLVKIDCSPPKDIVLVSDTPNIVPPNPTDMGTPPSVVENTFLSKMTININLFHHNNLAYGYTPSGNDGIKMSYSLGADYRISDQWITGTHIKKYGNLHYGSPVVSSDTTSVTQGESGFLFEMYLNKEKPFEYTRIFVGPRLSLVRWSSNDKNQFTGNTSTSAKYMLYSGIDFGIMFKLFSGLSLKTNLYLGNVYLGHDYIKPSSTLLSTYCGNVTAQLMYTISPNLSISGGMYNEGTPIFRGVNFNASYSFAPQTNLFYVPTLNIPDVSPIPDIIPTLPEEDQIASQPMDEPFSDTPGDNLDSEQLNWRESHKGKTLDVPIPDISLDAKPRSPTETIPVDRKEVERIPSEKIPIEKVPVERIPVENIPIDRIPVGEGSALRGMDETQVEESEEPFEIHEELDPILQSEPIEDADKSNEIENAERVIEKILLQFEVELTDDEVFEITTEDLETIEDIISTDEGKYFIFNKESSLAQNFRDTFSQAVKEGKPFFYWKNRKYSTKIK